ncbi:MAG: 4Fe-4S binding protein [Bacillota bacterium]
MKNEKTLEIKILKAMLAVYILLALVIAGLNYGYADQAAPAVAEFISWFWHFYENWVKTIFIICGSYLTLRVIAGSKSTTMRKRNLQGFIIIALIVHIIGPLLINVSELYLFSMPLPWTTFPLHLFCEESSFYQTRFPLWGVAGITAALIFFALINIVVFIGTLLLGRRWQCSTLCLFNGFAAEVFAPAFPLIGKRRKIKPAVLKIFSGLKWLLLFLALSFILFWVFYLSGLYISFDPEVITQVEVFKYLGAELLAMMFFWVVLTGRGYCYYCPLGTVLSFVGKLGGQKIVTDKSECIKCNRCNQACPLSIDIKSRAEKAMPVDNLRCVGCGHCIDICPTNTLAYQTKFLANIGK